MPANQYLQGPDFSAMTMMEAEQSVETFQGVKPIIQYKASTGYLDSLATCWALLRCLGGRPH